MKRLPIKKPEIEYLVKNGGLNFSIGRHPVRFKYNGIVIESDGQVNIFFNTLTPTPQPAHLTSFNSFIMTFNSTEIRKSVSN